LDLPQQTHDLLRRILFPSSHCKLLSYQFASHPLVQDLPGTPVPPLPFRKHPIYPDRRSSFSIDIMTRQAVREEAHSPGSPLVSVITPAYNSSAYIGETLASVFAQTFTNFEVIVINGGSPDTQQLELALQPYRDSIVYIKQANRGVAADRNAGVRVARGEYLAFLDGDDLWFPEYLASQMKFFEEMPSLDMIYCDARYFGDERQDDSTNIGNWRRAGTTCMEGSPSSGPVTFESLLAEQCSVVTSFTVARRRVVVECGMFEEKMFRAEDFHMWIRVAYHGSNIAYHKAVLGGHRLHHGSLASAATQSSQAVVAALEHILGSLDLTPERRFLVQRKIEKFQALADLHQGKVYLSVGEFEQARRSLAKANAFFRGPKLSLVVAGLRFAPRLTRLGFSTWQKFVLEKW
ncbi:MAG: glycosyltransferase family A protein, partial [Candidatus Korobacteraceae bacterium]